MLHTNRGELQLLMNTFCRIWEAGGQATLTTSTEGGELKAKLEIQLGSPAAPRPGAPSTTSGHPAASHRPCHRGPAAKARSRARAAAYQAKKICCCNSFFHRYCCWIKRSVSFFCLPATTTASSSSWIRRISFSFYPSSQCTIGRQQAPKYPSLSTCCRWATPCCVGGKR